MVVWQDMASGIIANHLKLLKPSPSSNLVIRVTLERKGSNQSFISVPTFHDFKLLKPNSLENCTIGCHKYLCTWPCFLFNHMNTSYEFGGRYKKLLKRRGYWSLLHWTNYLRRLWVSPLPFSWLKHPPSKLHALHITTCPWPWFLLARGNFSANPLDTCIFVCTCNRLTQESIQFLIRLQLQYNLRVCGCYLGRFSCSPTSTDEIYTEKLVLHYQIYNEASAEIGPPVISLWS